MVSFQALTFFFSHTVKLYDRVSLNILSVCGRYKGKVGGLV